MSRNQDPPVVAKAEATPEAVTKQVTFNSPKAGAKASITIAHLGEFQNGVPREISKQAELAFVARYGTDKLTTIEAILNNSTALNVTTIKEDTNAS